MIIESTSQILLFPILPFIEAVSGRFARHTLVISKLFSPPHHDLP